MPRPGSRLTRQQVQKRLEFLRGQMAKFPRGSSVQKGWAEARRVDVATFLKETDIPMRHLSLWSGMDRKAMAKLSRRPGQAAEIAARMREYRKIMRQEIKRGGQVTATHLAELGIPYDTANSLLKEAERQGRHEPPPDRAKIVGRTRPGTSERRQQLASLLKARKTIPRIIAMPGSPYKNNRQVYHDIFALRSAGENVIVPRGHEFRYEVAAIEQMIRENPAIRNSEIKSRLGLRNQQSFLERLREVPEAVLLSRHLPKSGFSRARVAEQNRTIQLLVRMGAPTSKIHLMLPEMTARQIEGRLERLREKQPFIKQLRHVGRSSFSAAEVRAQNGIIFGLARQGLTPAQMVGRKGLEGLGRRDIGHRLYRARKKGGKGK